ncbi:MAG: NUDIX hydrolase [Bacteroidales bacterium]|jgi:8-oxo-dGTP diphosphatase|nr:NUDIX hydrolase [Bacteroidales bacterium]
MIYTYAYQRPAVTVDIIVMRSINNLRNILLIKRKNEPYKNQWALPGGFIDIDEEIETAAYRELEEETSINDILLNQFKSFGKVGRDPRGRTISIIYTGELQNNNQKIEAGDDAKELKWFTLEDLPNLAFDHADIINEYLHLK